MGARALRGEAAAAEATEVAPEVTPSAEVTADIPTEADVADQAQPLPTTGSEPEADDTAKHSGAEILVAEAEKAEKAEADRAPTRRPRKRLRPDPHTPGRPAAAPPADQERACPDPSPTTEREERETMANFTAADIKTLREQTGAGMLDVKKALDEADGDHGQGRGDPARQGPQGRHQARGPHHLERPGRRQGRERRRHPRRGPLRDRLRRQERAVHRPGRAGPRPGHRGQGERRRRAAEEHARRRPHRPGAARRVQRRHRREDRGQAGRPRRGRARRRVPPQDQPRPAGSDRCPRGHRRRRRPGRPRHRHARRGAAARPP